MNWFVSALRRMRLLPEFSDDDTIDASIENTLYDHGKAVEAVKCATERRRSGNEQLRRILMAARVRSTTFSDFEHAIRREHDVRRHHQ